MSMKVNGNADRFRQQIAAYNRHDALTLSEGYADAATFTDHASRSTLTGPEAVREYVQTNFDSFPNDQFEIVDILEAGDWTTARLVSRGAHNGLWLGIEPTGREVSADVCIVSRWENGRIAEDHIYYDLYQMMEQIGQAPELAAAVA